MHVLLKAIKKILWPLLNKLSAFKMNGCFNMLMTHFLILKAQLKIKYVYNQFLTLPYLRYLNDMIC